MADEAHINVLAGLNDVHLHVDSLEARCISFLNGGGGDEFSTLLPYAEQMMLRVWWQARDSLASLREAGAISAGGSRYPKVSPDIPDGRDDYVDDERKAVASLVGAIGEVEQQIYHLMHAVDRDDIDVRKTEDALMMMGYLSSVALERVEAIAKGVPLSMPGMRGIPRP